MTRLSRQRSRWAASEDHAASTPFAATGPFVALNTAKMAPRHCRSVPCHDWRRRAGPSYAGRSARCHAHRSYTGQSGHRAHARQREEVEACLGHLAAVAFEHCLGRGV